MCLKQTDEHEENELLRSTKGKKICFIRFVGRWKEKKEECGVVILNRFIVISDPYVNQYVFATLNLQTATIIITTEHDGHTTQILKQHFPYTL